MARAKTKRLTLECLEERRVLTAFSVPWPESEDLTLSFAPDGTAAGSQPSDLFAALNAQMPTRQWELDILRAFQTWAVQSNINIGLVADGGQPFGTLGLKQGDPRFGDVRIGAFPMGADVLAVADPYDPFVANTWVGDVFPNSNFLFGGSGANPKYDLYSVVLHEAGHVFGLEHSTDPNSPMFPSFHKDESPTPADIANLRALYGVREPDQYEGPFGNETLATATPLAFGDSGGEANSIDIAADIGSLSDVDTYRLVAPQGSQSLRINLMVAGHSLLTPRMTVMDSAGRILSTSVTTDPLNNDLVIPLDNVKPGDSYYVQVAGGRDDVFGIGSYELHVTSQGSGLVASNGTNGNDSIPGPVKNNIQLLSTTPGYVEHTYYELDDTVSPAFATRTYEVQSADIGPDLTNVMTVVLDSSDSPGVHFTVTVRDDRGNLVAMKTIADSADHLELRALSIRSSRDYFVEVQSDNPPADGAEFELTVDYALVSNHLETYVNDSLAQDQRSVSRTLQVNQSEQFHFVLGASDFSAPTETAVRMEIVDQQGRIAYTMSVAAGTLRSGDVFLDPGRYSVVFARATDGVDTPVIFELSGLTASEPLGPQLQDTTNEPLDAPAASALRQLAFYWLPNDTNLAAAALMNEAPRAPDQARDSTGAESAAMLSRDVVDNRQQPVAALQVAQQAHEEQPAMAIVRPDRLDGMIAASDTSVAAAVLRQSSMSPSFSQRTAREGSVRPHEHPLVPRLRGPLWIGRAESDLADKTPAAVDNALSSAAEDHPSVGGNVPIAAAMSGVSRPLIERIFAWIQSLDASAYATWTTATLCTALGCLALKRLADSRREERFVESRPVGRDRSLSRRQRDTRRKALGMSRP